MLGRSLSRNYVGITERTHFSTNLNVKVCSTMVCDAHTREHAHRKQKTRKRLTTTLGCKEKRLSHKEKLERLLTKDLTMVAFEGISQSKIGNFGLVDDRRRCRGGLVLLKPAAAAPACNTHASIVGKITRFFSSLETWVALFLCFCSGGESQYRSTRFPLSRRSVSTG